MQPSPEAMAQMQLALAREEAREHQRRLMQGLGRPIISWADRNGYRCVCVGKEVHWSKTWQTFPDFLGDFIKRVMTPEWGGAEIKKPLAERHPLMQWYDKFCAFQRAQQRNDKGIYSAEPTGAVAAYLGLAYDLYLCAHNAELPELLLKRLRNPATFEGARYEARIIGSLARAGFTIELEDETDSKRSHCELTATHRQTGRKFSVECKAVSSSSSRAGTSSEPARIRSQLFKALSKQADHDRLIFIELNRAGIKPDDTDHAWVRDLDADLERAENEITIDGKPAPPAYVIVTNYGALHAIDDTKFAEAWLGLGFKISDFGNARPYRSILEIVDAQEKHKEMHWLKKALRRNDSFPNTFDDRLPEEMDIGDTPRLMIGSIYLIPDQDGKQIPGLLTEATVSESEKRVFGVYRTEEGRHLICANDLSEPELAAYRRSPNTFFGVIKEGPAKINEPMDAYEFFWGTYGETSKEKLIEFTKDWPDAAALHKLDQKRLAQVFCARYAEDMWWRKIQPLSQNQ